MALFIGKKGGESEGVHSIFRLIGKNEDALTYALAYAFEMNHPLLIDFLKEIKVLEAKQGRSYRLKNLKICLQEHDFNGKAGRRDIAIEFDDTRVVIEAKIDGSIPTEDQVLKYTLTRDEDENDIDFNYINQVWGPFKKRYIITLTKRKVPPGRYKDIKNLN